MHWSHSFESKEMTLNLYIKSKFLRSRPSEILGLVEIYGPNDLMLDQFDSYVIATGQIEEQEQMERQQKEAERQRNQSRRR